MEKEKDTVEKTKKKYEELKKKYNLPEFTKLMEDFPMEGLDDKTDFLLREIRKFVSDRFINYLRFIENILNPVNAQMFTYSIIKTLGQTEKEILTEIYKKLIKLEVNLIEIDIIYSEEKEAKFIKETFKIWQEIKVDFSKVIKTIKENWDIKAEKNGKNYFG